MKFAGQVKQIKGYSVRFVSLRRGLDDSGVEADTLNQGKFGRVREPIQRRLGEHRRTA